MLPTRIGEKRAEVEEDMVLELKSLRWVECIV
jgi:hypothetical protein